MNGKHGEKKRSALKVVLVIIIVLICIASFAIVSANLKIYRGKIWSMEKVGESIIMRGLWNEDAIWIVGEGDTKIPVTFESGKWTLNIIAVDGAGKTIELSDFAIDAKVGLDDRADTRI